MSNWSWLDSVISVAAILIGAMIVRWQVRQNARERLRLDIYREIQTAMKTLSMAEIDITSFARIVMVNLRLWCDPDFPGMPTSLQSNRGIQFVELINKLGQAHPSMLSVLEQYEVASPELKIFRTAFNVAVEDVRNAFDPLYKEYLKIMPLDVPEADQTKLGTKVIYRAPPNNDDLNRIQVLTDAFIDATDVIGNFVFDLGVEAQNLLLGNLFKHRVPRRKPLDPSITVITLDPKDVERLTEHFENETEWGRQKRETEERVSHEIGGG